MKSTYISASLLSANWAKLGDEAQALVDAGVDKLHIDAMDNHYVPNLTFGPQVCQALRQYGIKAPLDVHMMVKPVNDLIISFAKAGASCITIHSDSTEHLDRALQLIKEQGCQAGLALNPSSPLDCLDYVIDKLDLVLIMTVNPGFGGQSFIPAMIQKIQDTKKKLEGTSIQLQIDGGIKLNNIHALAEAGANSFAIGSALFANSDYKMTVEKFRQALK